MAKVLTEDFLIPVRWVETELSTTFENAKFSAAILKSNGITSVILVTQRWHMARAIWAFSQFGIHAVPTKYAYRDALSGNRWRDFVPTSSALLQSTYAIHELIGLVYYRYFKDLPQ